MSDNKPTYLQGIGWRYETIHSMHRRMADHDYQSRSIYMLTLTTEGRRNILGDIRWIPGKPESAAVIPTPLGEEVMRCWASIPKYHPEVRVLALQIMPDHIHGLLFVTKQQDVHLGHIVNGFKVGCNKAYRTLYPGPSASTASQAPLSDVSSRVPLSEATSPVPFSEAVPLNTRLPEATRSPKHPTHGMLFSPGYQDSILIGKDQLDRMFKYIDSNPYRLAVKRENPNLFRIVSNIEVNGIPFAAIGNRWLLDRPTRMQVRCHNNTTPANLSLIDKQQRYFLQRGQKGGVVVSPCISSGEKQIARAALDAGIPLIVILENGFPPMYKPPGRYFEACAQGRLLMLAPWPYHMEKHPITRAQCLALNDMAHTISTEPWTDELEERIAHNL